MLKYGTYKDGYQGVAKRGNQLLAELLADVKQDYELIETEDRYDPCDTIVSSQTKYVGCEVKVRADECRYYDTLLLEEYKWETSPQSAKDSGCTDWTYASFVGEEQHEDLCYIYNKGDIEKELEKGCKRKTIWGRKDTPTQDNGYTWIPSILIPKSASTIFQKTNGKWKLVSRPLSKR